MPTNDTPTHTTKITAATRNREARRRELLRRLRAAGPDGIAAADLARDLDVTRVTLTQDRHALIRAGTNVYLCPRERQMFWVIPGTRRRRAA